MRVIHQFKAGAATAFAGFFAAALPVSAQAPGPDQAAPLQAAATSSGPVRTLTLDDAVQLALEQNLGLQVERINLTLQDENVGMARAAFVPAFSSEFGYNNATTPPDSFLSGSRNTLRSDYVQGTAEVRQALPWLGASYWFGWDASRSTTNSVFTNFDPRLRSNFRFSLTQPLLRDLATDSRRTQLVVSKRNREISDVDLRAAIVRTVRNVKNAYWDLKAAIAGVDVQRQSLDLARQTLRDNLTRVQLGVMAPLDVVEARAEVARNEEALISAEFLVRQAEDRLRTLVFDPDMPDFWVMALDPVDAPQMQGRDIDIEDAIRNAFGRRTDLVSAHKSLDNVGEQLAFYRNQTMPQASLQIDYGATGLGGTQFIRGDGFPGPILGEATRPLGHVIGDVFRAAYPTWNVGLLFSYPLGRSSAEAGYARSRLQESQGRLQIKALELQIATEIRDAGRRVNTNAKRIDASRASRVLSAERLDAERLKFGVGLSTSFLVFQAQRDFVTARVTELRAILDYNKSLADFEALQEAALTGGGIVISGGGAFTATAAGSTIATAGTQRADR
jgi:outer membrane protein TolC